MNSFTNSDSVGIGSYSVGEAARLVGVSPLNIRRWLSGYAYKSLDGLRQMPPLWEVQLPKSGEHLEMGFRDLIELRFVKAFLGAGLPLQAIRSCLDVAREIVAADHPFATRRFRTDGTTIYLKSLNSAGESEVLDLRKRQYAIGRVIEQSFKDLDIEDDTVASWRPYMGKKSILIDPSRSFGQPIASKYGVPTVVLHDAIKAEGSASRVARLYEVPITVVRDAHEFEQSLLTA
jgi:DNA-binding transcriptional MerR regulator/uncharacterized protein (DUF433 family)